MRDRPWSELAVVPAVILLALTGLGGVHAASFAEPSTVFYGKVTGTGSAQPFLVTEGELTWTIRRADGSDLALRAPLFPLHGGEFSYRLDVPHTVLGAELQADDAAKGIPLPRVAQSHSHLSIAVDGMAARIAGASGTLFDADQARRAATYRLDLEVDLEAPDSDGDGLPDWWEEANGLDPEDPSDAAGDPDADGRNNLGEFLAGSDPQRDSTIPELLTTEVFANADGTSGVLLEVMDADSAPWQLVLSFESLPRSGELLLRAAVDDAEAPDRRLVPGSELALAEVQAGRLIYWHGSEEGALYDSFRVRVRDEDPAHPASSGEVAVHLLRPAFSELDGIPGERSAILPGSEPAVAPHVQSYLLSRDHEFVSWNLSATHRGAVVAAPTTALSSDGYETFVEDYGPERSQFLAGGAADDVLSGGMADDILEGGRGDDNLFGGGGADRFVWNDVHDGHDEILDFSVADGDVLVLTGLFAQRSGIVDDYLQLVQDGADALIKVGLAGDGMSYSDLSIRLVGAAAPELDLRALVASGALVVRPLELMTRVSLELLASASENGPQSGRVRLHRDGSAELPLTVNLVVSGAAANGVDYARISETVTIPAGASHYDLEIAPFPDALTEPAEVVEIRLASGAGYEIDPAGAWAQVAIEDLLPQLWLEVVRANGYADTSLPALVLLRRGSLIDRSLFVRLSYSGTASLGSHFSAPEFVALAAGQTSQLLQIVPREGSALAGGVGSVVLEIAADADYGLARPAWAEVVLADTEDRFGLWAQRHFEAQAEDLAALATLDPGGQGVTVLERYAYGLDPHAPHRDRSRLPEIWIGDDDRLHVEFFRSAAVRDLTFGLEMSSDLESWQPAGDRFERYLVPWEEDAPGRSAYRSSLPVDAQENLYLRIRSTLQQP